MCPPSPVYKQGWRSLPTAFCNLAMDKDRRTGYADAGATNHNVEVFCRNYLHAPAACFQNAQGVVAVAGRISVSSALVVSVGVDEHSVLHLTDN